jgi:hypothetical protein
MQKHVQKKNEKPHTLIGTWINGDEYETDVEYIVPSGHFPQSSGLHIHLHPARNEEQEGNRTN